MNQIINNRYKILIVDDEEKHVSATMKYLTANGFKTFGANSAETAFSLLQKIQPDLIILDILMPNIDGYQFITKLKTISQLNQVPFLFLTAKGMTQDRIKGYLFGCSGYIPKPFDPDELVAIIRNILIRKSQKVLTLELILIEVKILNRKLNDNSIVSDNLILSLDLTPREIIILNYLFKGLKNKEIADCLNTGIRNVEKYVTKLFGKTQTRNRVELLNYCYSNKKILKANDGIRTRE